MKKPKPKPRYRVTKTVLNYKCDDGTSIGQMSERELRYKLHRALRKIDRIQSGYLALSRAIL